MPYLGITTPQMRRLYELTQWIAGATCTKISVATGKRPVITNLVLIALCRLLDRFLRNRSASLSMAAAESTMEHIMADMIPGAVRRCPANMSPGSARCRWGLRPIVGRSRPTLMLDMMHATPSP